jgi:hypothetical protein
VRLYALYTNGGIYLDTDVEVLKKFDPLLQECCFAGFDATTEDTLEDGEWVAGGVIGTPPNHHFVKWALDLTCRLFEETGKFYKGPAVLTMLLKELGLKSYGSQMIKGVKLYPLEYFYPYPCGATFQKDCITDKTYSVHHWELSWVKQGYLQLHTREQK